MKTWKIILLLIIFLLAACGAPALESEPSPEALRSTATAEMATLTPTVTAALTATITPILPTATPIDLFYNYEIDPNAPVEDVEYIKKGIALAHAYIAEVMGDAIPTEVQPSITVKIVASGKGNLDPGAGGACCTSLNKKGAVIFIDVLHPEWIINAHQPTMMWSAEKNAIIIPAHEFIHAWQYSLGCISLNYQPFGDWMNEGIAHYLAHQMMIKNGILKQNIIEQSMIQGASVMGQMSAPLRDYFGPGSEIWPGHIGYFAVKFLVENSSTGFQSLKIVCEDVAKGVDFEQAFKQNFGLELEEFYAQFESFRANSGLVIRGKVIGDPERWKYDELLLVVCNHSLGDCLRTATVGQDGSFNILDVAMGPTSIEIKNSKSGETIGWYNENGVSPQACATKISLPRITFDELIITLQQQDCP